MIKKYTGNYVLSWYDKNNKYMNKVYTDYQTSLKAKKWLLDNGGSNIDIAVEIITTNNKTDNK